MPKISSLWSLVTIAGCLLVAQPAVAAETRTSPLVGVEWLSKRSDDVRLLDASPAPMFAAGHIPGAINVDLFSYGLNEIPLAEMERRFRSWGLSAGKKIVIYDQGGSYSATRVFWDLYYHGFAAEELAVLDGGLAKWQASGGAVTREPTPAPPPGTFRVTKRNEDVRVRLPEFLAASGDPANQTLVEALEPNYHFGESKFFDRAGHIPNGIMLPNEDLFKPDKTFKDPAEIQRMMNYLGVRPEQQVSTYCGGGVAASVPFFALKFILDYPKVKLYKESELEWLQDQRELPFWTYDAPYLKRDMNWLNGWGSRMMRMYGGAQLSVVDVRSAEAFNQGHVPYALNIPAEVFKSYLASPERLAALLGPAGVNAAHEAVIVSDGGLNESSALAFLMLEKAGQKKVSILSDSVDEWGLRGLPLTKEPTVVGARKSPQDLVLPVSVYAPRLRAGVVIANPGASQGAYPKVFIASGKTIPAQAPIGKVVHLPYGDLLNSDGTAKPAKDIWKILVKAGVPRYAEIVLFSERPGEAAVNYFVLKLMGYPDVKVLLL